MSDHLNSILVKSDWRFNQEQPPEMFHKKAYFKTFAVFTGKQLSWSLFSLLFCEYCEIFKNNFFEDCLSKDRRAVHRVKANSTTIDKE